MALLTADDWQTVAGHYSLVRLVALLLKLAQLADT